MNLRRRTLRSFAVVLACTALCTALLGQETAPAGSEVAAVQVSARKYEFNPPVITVKQGDHVKLVITATDRDHGFKLPGYGIEQRLPKGVPTTVEFTADKPGTFPFQCSVVCGLGHGRMKGKLVVQPAPGGGSSPSP